MLSPEELQDIPQEIVELWKELDDYIFNDICRRVSKAGELTSTAEYQLYVLNVLGKSEEEVKKKVQQTLDLSDEKLEKLFANASEVNARREKAEYVKAGLELEYSDTIEKYSRIYAEQTLNEMKNFTRTLGYVNGGQAQTLTQYYLANMDKAHLLVNSGGISYNTAIKMVVNEMSSRGICFINYKSNTAMNLQSAVERAIRTGVNQCCLKASGEFIEDNNVEYVEISSHIDARPTHAVWQGQVMKYSELPERTGYGTVTGLGGANCRHSFSAYFPGISVRRPQEEIKKIEIDGREFTPYEISQQQRYMERQIRKYKRRIRALNKLDIPHQEDTALKSAWMHKYKELCSKAGTRLYTERLVVY